MMNQWHGVRTQSHPPQNPSACIGREKFATVDVLLYGFYEVAACGVLTEIKITKIWKLNCI